MCRFSFVSVNTSRSIVFQRFAQACVVTDSSGLSGLRPTCDYLSRAFVSVASITMTYTSYNHGIEQERRNICSSSRCRFLEGREARRYNGYGSMGSELCEESVAEMKGFACVSVATRSEERTSWQA